MSEIKYITEYSEFGGTGDSLVGHYRKLPNEDKHLILKYLKEHKTVAVKCCLIHDYVQDIITTLGTEIHSDGEYNWGDDEIYHFENYDIELNEDFVEKVLNG